MSCSDSTIYCSSAGSTFIKRLSIGFFLFHHCCVALYNTKIDFTKIRGGYVVYFITVDRTTNRQKRFASRYIPQSLHCGIWIAPVKYSNHNNLFVYSNFLKIQLEEKKKTTCSLRERRARRKKTR